MKIAVLSTYNPGGIPGALCKQLNRLAGFEAKCISYLEPAYGYQCDVVLKKLGLSEFEQTLEEITSADIIHVFDDPFQTKDFRLEEHLKPGKALFTYTPQAFAKNYGEIFFRHYQSELVATTLPLTAPLKACPLPVIHMPPVLDLDDMPVRNQGLVNGPQVLAIATQYGHRGHMEQILQLLFELQQRMDLTVNWLEHISRKDYLSEMANANFFLDDLSYNGISNLGLEAMAVGIPVMANMSGLDFSVLPEAPIIAVTPETLLKRLAKLANSPKLLVELGDRSRGWIHERLDPTKTVSVWAALYHHVLAQGKAIPHNPYFPDLV